MKASSTRRAGEALRIMVLSVLISLSVGYAFANWQAPGLPPPGGNPNPPINVGPDSQRKVGNLFLDNSLIANTGLFSAVTARRIDATNAGGVSTIGIDGPSGNIQAQGIASNAVSTQFFDTPRITLSGVTKTSWPALDCAPVERGVHSNNDRAICNTTAGYFLTGCSVKCNNSGGGPGGPITRPYELNMRADGQCVVQSPTPPGGYCAGDPFTVIAMCCRIVQN